MSPLDVPVDPAPPEATQWLLDELARPEYAAAQPTIVDLVGRAIADWLNGILSGSSGAPPLLALVIGLAVVAAIVVVAIVFGGRVRLARRAAAPHDLFDGDERRSARDLRDAAAEAAWRGDWAAATADAYRAIARGAAEREIVAVVPGMTAHGFATIAAGAFPMEAAALADAADAFDAVRYLGRAGSEEDYRAVAALGARLDAARAERVAG